MATQEEIDKVIEIVGVLEEIVDDLDSMAEDVKDLSNIKQTDRAELFNDLSESANILRRVYNEIHDIASPFLDDEEDEEEEGDEG